MLNTTVSAIFVTFMAVNFAACLWITTAEMLYDPTGQHWLIVDMGRALARGLRRIWKALA